LLTQGVAPTAAPPCDVQYELLMGIKTAITGFYLPIPAKMQKNTPQAKIL
jgi:hypothetical protein